MLGVNGNSRNLITAYDLDGYITNRLNSQEQTLYDNHKAKALVYISNGVLAWYLMLDTILHNNGVGLKSGKDNPNTVLHSTFKKKTTEKVDGGYCRTIKNGKLAWSDSSGKK